MARSSESCSDRMRCGVNVNRRLLRWMTGRGKATMSGPQPDHLHIKHASVDMSLVYAQISDREVLRDYDSVLGSGATIAGPSAEALRAGVLPQSAIDWLKSN